MNWSIWVNIIVHKCIWVPPPISFCMHKEKWKLYYTSTNVTNLLQFILTKTWCWLGLFASHLINFICSGIYTKMTFNWINTSQIFTKLYCMWWCTIDYTMIRFYETVYEWTDKFKETDMNVMQELWNTRARS